MGSRNTVIYDRDYTHIKGKAVRHTTAARDWVCGACGSRLVTHFYPDAPHWRTVCHQDEGHDPDEFVHQSTWAYVEGQRLLEAEQAKEVFAHLPLELQTAISTA